MPTELKTGVGRVVWGKPGVAQVKKYRDGPQKGQTVMKDGQPVHEWPIGVAFPKEATLRAQNAGNPNIEAIVAANAFERTIWPAMAAEIATGYPNGAPQRFAYKYDDGDTIDSNGKPFAERDGYAGHFVLTVSTSYQAPPIYKLENNVYRQLTAEEIKCGDYVALGLNLVVNVPPAGSTNTPSIYVNPQVIELVAYGTTIVSRGAVDPMAVLGGQAATYIPPGATATPQAAVGAPGMPGMPGGTPTPPAPGLPAPPAPMAAPTPPPPPAPVTPPPAPAMARPVDPSHIAPNPAGGELWWNGTTWVPGAATLPPPAPEFVTNVTGQPPAPPGMPPMPGR